MYWVTLTVPGTLTRPMSLRPRSSSMMCSACCFSLPFNSSSKARSSAGVWPRGRVPAMGWVEDGAIVDRGHGLDGGADDLEPVEVQVVHIGRRVAAPQGPVHLEGVSIGVTAEPLRVHHLYDVAGVDVLNALLDDGFVFPAR